VNERCDCSVNGCKDGDFLAILGNIVLKNKESISTETYTTSLYPQTTGSIDVDVTCRNPKVQDHTSILVGGGQATTIPEGNFVGSNFRCTSTSSGYRCSLDYDNRYGPAYLVFFFSNSGGEIIDHTDPPISVGLGSDSRYDDFTCSGHPGNYHVSWTAYSDRDLTNPIPGAWPNPDGRAVISCAS